MQKELDKLAPQIDKVCTPPLPSLSMCLCTPLFTIHCVTICNVTFTFVCLCAL